MARCYIVTITDEVLVVADSPEEAIQIIRENESDIASSTMIEDRIDSVKIATYMPDLWDDDSLVWGNHSGGMTAAEAMALNKERK